MASTTSHIRKYFCMKPLSDACKKGFLSLGSYTQHRNTKHNPASKLSHTAQYPHIPEMPSTQAGTVPYKHQGAPCDANGQMLSEEMSSPSPLSSDKVNLNPWHPFESPAKYELANFLYCKNQMSAVGF
jgi:hypothetical protein